jgi:hypothetical protein
VKRFVAAVFLRCDRESQKSDVSSRAIHWTRASFEFFLSCEAELVGRIIFASAADSFPMPLLFRPSLRRFSNFRSECVEETHIAQGRGEASRRDWPRRSSIRFS